MKLLKTSMFLKQSRSFREYLCRNIPKCAISSLHRMVEILWHKWINSVLGLWQNWRLQQRLREIYPEVSPARFCVPIVSLANSLLHGRAPDGSLWQHCQTRVCARNCDSPSDHTCSLQCQHSNPTGPGVIRSVIYPSRAPTDPQCKGILVKWHIPLHLVPAEVHKWVATLTQFTGGSSVLTNESDPPAQARITACFPLYPLNMIKSQCDQFSHWQEHINLSEYYRPMCEMLLLWLIKIGGMFSTVILLKS